LPPYYLKIKLPERRGEPAVYENCIGFFRGGTAPRPGGRSSCHIIKNWKGFAVHWWVTGNWVFHTGSIGLAMRNVTQCPAAVDLISATTCLETPVSARSFR